MRFLLLALLCLAALLLAAPSHAQDELPPSLRTPVNDPRRGPRLDYERGTARCPDEKTFRHEVAYWVDGRDHLAADSPDVVHVRLAWTPKGYVGVVTYTDASGKTTTVATVTRDGNHCPMLVRWVALEVSDLIPDRPPPPPCPTCPECPACSRCTACPACPPAEKPPPCPLQPRRWYMDLTIGLSAYGMMSVFLTPNVAPGVGLAVDVRGEFISVAIEARGVLPSQAVATERLPGKSSFFPVEFDLSQFTGLVVPCAHWKYLVGCAVVQVGILNLKTVLEEDAVTTWGLGPRLGFEVPFAERFAVFGFGEVLFAPTPFGARFSEPPPGMPDGAVANVRWQQSAASAFFGAGLSVKFK